MTDNKDDGNDEKKLEDAQNQVNPMEQIKAAQNLIQEQQVAFSKKAGGEGGGTVSNDSGIVQQFKALPLGMLLCEPVLQVARGQAALCDIYISNLNRLAFENPDEKDPAKKVTKIISFPYEKPVVDKVTGQVSKKMFNIAAPLISLVPIPAFLMEELTVAFTMEVKETESSTDKTHSEVSTKAEFGFWTCSASVSGSVSADTSHTRTTDNSAKYELHLRAAQQPAAEGMAKLTSLLAQTMEPIEMSK